MDVVIVRLLQRKFPHVVDFLSCAQTENYADLVIN